MNFDRRAPCKDCPFLKEGGIRLDRRRVEEIAGMMLSSSGGTFACHETTGVKEGKRRPEREQAHCAGALIFAEKANPGGTQMMRIAERLGMYDRTLLMANQAVVDRVFDSEDEMLQKAWDR